MNDKYECLRCKRELEEEMIEYSKHCITCQRLIADKWALAKKMIDKVLLETEDFSKGKDLEK